MYPIQNGSYGNYQGEIYLLHSSISVRVKRMEKLDPIMPCVFLVGW